MAYVHVFSSSFFSAKIRSQVWVVNYTWIYMYKVSPKCTQLYSGCVPWYSGSYCRDIDDNKFTSYLIWFNLMLNTRAFLYLKILNANNLIRNSVRLCVCEAGFFSNNWLVCVCNPAGIWLPYSPTLKHTLNR